MPHQLGELSRLTLNARQGNILETLRRRGQLAIVDLAEMLEVSTETIRRDLRLLAAKGLVDKQHGNVRWRQPNDEQPLQRRMLDNRAGKQAIAAALAREIADGESLFLDTGSTNLYIAQALKAHRGLTVVTTSAPIGQTLSIGQGNRVFLAGGELRADDSAAFGSSAISFISQFKVKSAIITPAGLDPRRGAMLVHLAEAEISRAAAAHAERVIVALDHLPDKAARALIQFFAVNRLEANVVTGNLAKLADIA